MRSNQNLSGSTDRGVAGKQLGMTRMPAEWWEAGSWRLPSGKALAEFALQAGFLAPLLFKAEQFGSDPTTFQGGGCHPESAMAAPIKQFGKGSSE